MFKRFISNPFNKRADKYSKEIPGSLVVGDFEIARLEALGGDKPGITQVGRLSVSGYIGDQKVKVYTAHSLKHAELLGRLHALKFVNCQLPPLVTIEGRVVVEGWVPGDSLEVLKGEARNKVDEKVDAFLSELQHVDVEASGLVASAEAFCYFQDYLVARLSEWRHHREIGGFLDNWLSMYGELHGSLGKRISHPDLSARNLILDSITGCVKVIDNELLGLGHGWLLDRHNSLLSKSTLYAGSRLAGVPTEFIDKTWKLRLLGSALDEGRFDKVKKILNV